MDWIKKKNLDGISSKMLCGCLLGDGPDPGNPQAGLGVDVVAPEFNFDNIMNAVGLLFEITTTEGWVDVMQAAADVPYHPDMQPVTNQSMTLSYIYFIIWMLAGSFLIVQVVVAVLCDQFERIKNENEGSAFSTVEQREAAMEWQRTVKWTMALKPKMKLKPLNVWAFELFLGNTTKVPMDGTSYFDFFIMTCIGLNTFTMALKMLSMSDDLLRFLEMCNLAFAAIFTVEAILKLMAVGWSQYWKDAWNKFDFIIVVGTLGGLAMEHLSDVEIGSVASIVRMFR